MTSRQAGGKAAPPEGEQRRAERLILSVPVKVTWVTKEGARLTEQAHTEEVSRYGALLRMKSRLPILMEVELSHARTHQSTRARVAGMRHPEPNGTVRVPVELCVPSETFWGITFPSRSRADSS